MVYKVCVSFQLSYVIAQFNLINGNTYHNIIYMPLDLKKAYSNS